MAFAITCRTYTLIEHNISSQPPQSKPHAIASITNEGLVNDVEKRAQEVQRQNQQALHMTDRDIAKTVLQQSLGQASKMYVDTTNAITNGYLDSANKANNANTQTGKGINF